MKTVRLTKIRESETPLHPNNIPAGKVHEGEFIALPKVGECFWVDEYWRTSIVQEIIDDKTFRTCNSIYQYEVF